MIRTRTHPNFPWLATTALLMALSGHAFAETPTPGTSANAREIPARALEEAIAKYPLFAMLVEDRPGFRQDWQKRLQQRRQESPANGNGTEPALQAGLGLAMDAAKPYLMRASDAASNQFLLSLSRIIAEGEKDPEVCLAYVEPGRDDTQTAQRREMVETRLGTLIVEDLLRSLTAVVNSGRNGEQRVLTRQEMQAAIQPVILEIVDRHGVDALQGLANLENRQVPPMQRCQTMSRMLDAFAVQPEARRAMLARTLFSGALPRK